MKIHPSKPKPRPAKGIFLDAAFLARIEVARRANPCVKIGRLIAEVRAAELAQTNDHIDQLLAGHRDYFLRASPAGTGPRLH